MSRGMQPKIGAEPMRLGGNRDFYGPKERQSHVEDLAESHINFAFIDTCLPYGHTVSGYRVISRVISGPGANRIIYLRGL